MKNPDINISKSQRFRGFVSYLFLLIFIGLPGWWFITFGIIKIISGIIFLLLVALIIVDIFILPKEIHCTISSIKIYHISGNSSSRQHINIYTNIGYYKLTDANRNYHDLKRIILNATPVVKEYYGISTWMNTSTTNEEADPNIIIYKSLIFGEILGIKILTNRVLHA